MRLCTRCAFDHCMFVSSCVQLPSIALAAHYGFLGSSKSQRWSAHARSTSFKHSCCVLFPVPSYSHEEIVPAHYETPGVVVVKPC